ncbi:MAG: hypothetical protein A2516_08175 [Alphaproteobacteria bacterium RIFOXYD12_FULL_60_8]|nr:MAG: hypothetical protein A2516_08175 [Alphaproteobacteria bacterium RIFOXYD12_FULL_60_8]
MNAAAIQPTTPKDETMSTPDAPKTHCVKADQVLEVAEMLLDLLDEENEALTHHDDAKVVQLADRKDGLARLYADHMNSIARAPSLLDDISDEQREDLKGVAEDLKEAGELNIRLLKGEMEANRRLMRAIVDAVKEKHAETSIYARDGSIEDGLSKGLNSALTFNKEL